jgi:hypothetical protein
MSWRLSCRPIGTRLHHSGDSCQICQFATYRQNSACNAAHRPMNRGEPKQSQINSKDGPDYQANRDHMQRFNEGKQHVVLANVVRQRAVLDI